MKKRKIFTLKAIVLSSILFTSSYSASPLIVSDPELLASQGTAIEKMVDSIVKYETMINQGVDQINRLGQITEVLNATQRFISGSALKIATPFAVLKALQSNIESIKASYKRLENTIKNYDWRDHIKEKRMTGKCPWLRYDLIGSEDLKMFFNQTGEETPLMKDAKQLFELLSDDAYSNMSSLVGKLSGRAYAEFLCELAIEEQERKAVSENIAKQKRAMLDGDFEEQEKLRKEGLKNALKTRAKQEERMRGLWQPLINRNTQFLQTLGIKDKSLNTATTKYCKEGKNGDGEEFCYPILLKSTEIGHRFDKAMQKLSQDLVSAGTDTDTQAQAYSDFSQEAQRLQLEYAKNQAESLDFLNETMSLMSSLMAEEYKRKYQTINPAPVNNQSFATEESILEKNDRGDLSIFQAQKPDMDKFGFPTLNVGGKSTETE